MNAPTAVRFISADSRVNLISALYTHALFPFFNPLYINFKQITTVAANDTSAGSLSPLCIPGALLNFCVTCGASDACSVNGTSKYPASSLQASNNTATDAVDSYQ
jgi:hypothetical protein